MGNLIQLRLDCLVQLISSMSMDIAPKRRNSIEIPSTMHIDEIMTVGVADNARLLTHPLLHLGKGVPNVSMVEPFKFVVRERHLRP
jgi:hypothetical protein